MMIERGGNDCDEDGDEEGCKILEKRVGELVRVWIGYYFYCSGI